MHLWHAFSASLEGSEINEHKKKSILISPSLAASQPERDWHKNDIMPQNGNFQRQQPLTLILFITLLANDINTS